MINVDILIKNCQWRRKELLRLWSRWSQVQILLSRIREIAQPGRATFVLFSPVPWHIKNESVAKNRDTSTVNRKALFACSPILNFSRWRRKGILRAMKKPFSFVPRLFYFKEDLCLG